jgi:phospholipid/cholesterol/gamma-HCH transport system substrate-binding protein
VIYAKFTDVGALEISNPVKIKGFRIGNVYKIGNTDKKVTEVVVTINLQEDVLIPRNSVAIISSSLTGTSSINIMPGNSSDYIKEGDTLQSSNNPDLLGKVMNSLDPILISAKQTIDTLKRVLVSFNDILDPQAQANIKGIIANLESGTANLNGLLDNQNGALAKTLTNAEEFTRNLNQNNEKLKASIENFHQFSDKLSDVEIKTTVDELKRFTADENGNYSADAGNDDIVMSLVLFSWLIFEYNEFHDMEFRKELKAELERELIENTAPFVFYDNGIDIIQPGLNQNVHHF